VLTESLYLMFPEQEAALRNGDFLDRLAQAHIRGLEKFLLGRVRE
jgi:N-acetylmuramoyl-L-alanine amidase